MTSDSTPLPSVGWIGTGVMGAPMAGHLQAAGHPLHLTTRTQSKAKTLLEAGATWHDTPAGVAAESDIICIMVGYPADVRATVLGPEGVLATAKSGSLLIDFTTSEPTLAEEIAAAASERGIESLDAPVSGGDVGAQNATLSIMVGGTPEAFARAEPILQRLGKTIVHQGPPGCGQHTKAVNQITNAGIMLSMCEALLYAKRSGLDPEVVLQSIGGGAASSWALKNLYPRIVAGNLDPGFYIEHYVKDMTIARAEAERFGLDLPTLALALDRYQHLVENGAGRLGTHALIKALDPETKDGGAG